MSDLRHSCLRLEIIETTRKFSNVVDYHHPKLSFNRTVNASCLLLDSIIGQPIRRACIIGWYGSCVYAVVAHLAEVTVVFSEKVWQMASLFLNLSHDVIDW